MTDKSTETAVVVGHTPGPLTVRVSERWPYTVETLDQSGEVMFSDPMWAHSTKMKSLDDLWAGVGFIGPGRDEAIEANRRVVPWIGVRHLRNILAALPSVPAGGLGASLRDTHRAADEDVLGLPAQICHPRDEENAQRLLKDYRRFISSTPALQSLLYDADMLPEQTVTVRGAVSVAAVCEAFRAGQMQAATSDDKQPGTDDAPCVGSEPSPPAEYAAGGWTEPCGGCGETDPAQRCIGCMHVFSPTTPASLDGGE